MKKDCAPAHDDPAEVGRYLVPAARRGEVQEPGEPEGDGARAHPLPHRDVEAEVGPEDGDQEEQLHRQDRLHHRQTADVQREGLEEERAHHEPETQEPDPSPDGVGQQAEPHGGLLRGVLYPHALEDAGQSVGEGRRYGEDVDHRCSCDANGRLSQSTQSALSWRSGRGTCAAGPRLDAGILCLQTGIAPNRIPVRHLPAEIQRSRPTNNVAVRLRLGHLPALGVLEAVGDRPSPGRPMSIRGVQWD